VGIFSLSQLANIDDGKDAGKLDEALAKVKTLIGNQASHPGPPHLAGKGRYYFHVSGQNSSDATC
jgi:hypothetical protein